MLVKKEDRLTITYVRPAKLKQGLNPRKITERAFAKLKRAIEEAGFVDPIIARKKDGLIIGGHQRLRASVELGYKQVPVVFLKRVTDAEAEWLNLILNNQEAQGEWDYDVLATIFATMKKKGIDPTLSGFDQAQIDALAEGWDGPKPADDPGEYDPDKETFTIKVERVSAKHKPKVTKAINKALDEGGWKYEAKAY